MTVLANRRYPEWAPPGTALIGPLPEERGPRGEAMVARLLELGRVALAILDADAARECLRPSSRIAISPDDYEYDVELCNALKRGLLRVERLSDLDVQTAVWRLRPDLPGMADLLLAGKGYPRQFAGWNQYAIPVPEAMQCAFNGEPGVALSEHARWVSVFVPLRDSLDDIVGVLQLCTGLDGEPLPVL
jgi:hypothetical protein